MTMPTNHELRQRADLKLAAIWYAWGRQDAEGVTVDVFEFGDHYAELAANPAGRPSVQDAFKAYRDR